MSYEKLLKFQKSDNIAEEIDDEQTAKIASIVHTEYELDKVSRADWETMYEKIVKIATLKPEKKNTPWEDAASTKYPLITNASMSFAANEYKELLKNGRVVEAEVIGDDPAGQKEARAKRVTDYMNYQLLCESDTWEPGTDRLLHMLPTIGTVFRKTYYDPITRMPCIDVCNPEDIVINNDVRSLESARRVTHVLHIYKNDIVSMINAGFYCDIDLEHLNSSSPEGDNDPQLEVLEQHRFLDLDEDGYQEPYIVTILKETKELLRIVARYDIEGIRTNEKGKIITIDPVQYFTDYHFIPSPDGKYYSLGFGHLLYSINETINTLQNQLIDAGTLANNQSGFVTRGIKLPSGGVIRMKRGEFQVLDTIPNQTIRDQFFQPDFKDPSNVLFQLLGLMVQSGKELSAIHSMMQGDQQAQNSPATTVMALLDRGMTLYSSIQRRLFKSLKKEFDKLFRLNKIYLDQKVYFNIEDNQLAIAKEDFEIAKYDVKPVADPTIASTTQRLLRAQTLVQMLAQPGIGQELNPTQIAVNMLQELEVKNVEKYINTQKAPDPAMIQAQADIQTKMVQAQADMLKAQTDQHNAETKRMLAQIKANESGAKIEKMHADAMHNMANVQLQSDQANTNKVQTILDNQNEKEKLRIEEKKVDVKPNRNSPVAG